jgi:fructose-bisphosphate aldolase class II
MTAACVTITHMKTLRDYLIEAKESGTAVGHFNVGTYEMVRPIVAAAQKTGLPVIIGVSEGERDAIGVGAIVAIIKELREETGHPIFLNADHTYSVERVKEAIDAGFDSAIFDGAQLPIEENIAQVKECVAYARASGRDVLIEGELGFIGVGSQLLDSLPEGAAVTEEMMTSPEDAKRFVEETGVDLLAPAVGNIHGMLKSGMHQTLSIPRIAAISKAAGVPLVLHGGSGTTDEDYRDAIKAGIAEVHVSTELRRAFKDALEESLEASGGELAPYKYLKPADAAVGEIVEARLELFAGRR